MNNKTQQKSTVTDLFTEIVRLHDEQNGGTENFIIVDENTIGCRYGDCCISRQKDGWRYGSNSIAYPTPAQAFENRANDCPF